MYRDGEGRMECFVGAVAKDARRRGRGPADGITIVDCVSMCW